jgi:D-3-phosphoglycerate dehydrogenase
VPTFLFDFDSTLIDGESLDEILAQVAPLRADEIASITREGMEGTISFRESLGRRLAIGSLLRSHAEAFGQGAVSRLTAGMGELIGRLRADVWIVSGALREVLLPTAKHLGIPAERVFGTRVRWDGEGRLVGLGDRVEKVELVRDLASDWPRPRVAVGDGMSDYSLFEQGCVDHFIAFTLHARRQSVVETGAPEARTVRELEYLLADFK